MELRIELRKRREREARIWDGSDDPEASSVATAARRRSLTFKQAGVELHRAAQQIGRPSNVAPQQIVLEISLEISTDSTSKLLSLAAGVPTTLVGTARA